MTEHGDAYLELTADIVCAYVSNNQLPARDVPKLIVNVYEALVQLQANRDATSKAIARGMYQQRFEGVENKELAVKQASCPPNDCPPHAGDQPVR